MRFPTDAGPVGRAIPAPVRRALAAIAGDQEGAAILEFLLVLPILLALLGGAFELGRALLVREAMIEAVRGGARYLARVPDPRCDNVCTPGAARARALTRAMIVENTGLAPAAVDVAARWNPDTTTVTMLARLSLSNDMLRFVGLGPLLTLEVAHQEQRVGE